MHSSMGKSRGLLRRRVKKRSRGLTAPTIHYKEVFRSGLSRARLSHWLLDLIFPVHCVGCHQEGLWLCKQCQEKMLLEKVKPSKVPFALPHRLLYAFAYQHPLVKRLISLYKYYYISEISKILALFLIGIFSPYLKTHKPEDFCLLPIPLHKKRLRQRGFNQAALLAQELAQKLDIDLDNDILIRRRHTRPQVDLDHSLREQNINNAFWARKETDLNGRIIILVDDVSTSGTTLREAARTILKKNRPQEVWGLVVAKG